jgi:hypothetical protein
MAHGVVKISVWQKMTKMHLDDGGGSNDKVCA